MVNGRFLGEQAVVDRRFGISRQIPNGMLARIFIKSKSLESDEKTNRICI
jgi:hypothetical protein